MRTLAEILTPTGIFILMQARAGHGPAVLIVSGPIAMLGSILITKIVVAGMARWLPTVETNARRRHELLGLVGEAVFAINEKFGMSSVRDLQGDLYQVP